MAVLLHRFLGLATLRSAQRPLRRARLADVFEQNRGGLIIGVLWHQLAFEGALEDGLAEARRSYDCTVKFKFYLYL